MAKPLCGLNNFGKSALSRRSSSLTVSFAAAISFMPLLPASAHRIQWDCSACQIGERRTDPGTTPMNARHAAAVASSASSLILLREDVGGVAVLTLNQPQTRNSLSEAMLEALGDAFTAIAHDDAVRAVVLAANGPAFSAGHDLKELIRASRRRRSRARLFQAHHEHLQRHDAADRHAAAAGHRRGAGDRDGGGLPAGGELRSRDCLAHREVRDARRQYRPVLLDADGRALAQCRAQARDGDAAHRRR